MTVQDSLDSALLRRRLYLDEAAALRAEAERSRSEEEREQLLTMAAQYEHMAAGGDGASLSASEI